MHHSRHDLIVIIVCPFQVHGVSTYNPVVLPKPPVTDVNSRTPTDADWRQDAWEEAEEPFKRLTREEAQALRAWLPVVSPWHVVAAQAVVGVAVAVVSWLLAGRSNVAWWSALYGVAAAVVPNALLARGATPVPGAGAVAVALRFLLWEFMKIGVAILMLGMATKVVPGLRWPVLLIALIVCIKVNWLALLWRGRVKTRS